MSGPFDFAETADRPHRVHVTHRQEASINGILSGVLKISAALVLLLIAFYLTLPIIDGVGRVRKAADKVNAEKRMKATSPGVGSP